MTTDWRVRCAKELEEAFPAADPECEVLGNRVLLQMMSVKDRTDSGIILQREEASEIEWNTQVAKVLQVGPLAFRMKDSLEPWPEGIWVKPGDYVRCFRWGGDRFEVPVHGVPRVSKARFLICNDRELIARITGNPLAVNPYML